MSESTIYIPPERTVRPRGAFVPPLLVIPFLVYNLIVFAFMGGNPAAWSGTAWSVNMVSGQSWVLTWGDLMLVLGLVCLFVEVVKSTQTGRNSVVEHMLSTLLLVAFLVEFLLVGGAASSVFFLLMIMSIVDVVAGFTISITGAGRDVTMAP
jgi:hypothetical protein